jgi:hypothetical protein
MQRTEGNGLSKYGESLGLLLEDVIVRWVGLQLASHRRSDLISLLLLCLALFRLLVNFFARPLLAGFIDLGRAIRCAIGR